MIKDYDLRCLSGAQYVRALCFVLLGAVCSFQVNAAAFPSTQSGNRTTFSAGTYDTDAIAAGASLAVSAGAIWASQTNPIKTVAGVAANVVVRAAPAAGAIRSAVAACFGNPLCVVATAAAAAYVANELSFNYTVGADGVPLVTKADPTACTVAPCYNWRVYGYNGTQFEQNFPSLAAAKMFWEARIQKANADAGNPPVNFTWYSSASDGSGYYACENGGCYYTGGVQRVGRRAPDTSATVPSTPTELVDAIGSKTDWADNSKLPQLIKDAVIAGQPKLGTYQNPYIVPLSVPTSITGPATVAGSPTTPTKADGSKVTKTTTTNFGYYPPAVEATETTVETATTPAGVTTTTSTTTSPATVAQQTPDLCATNPNSNACRTDEFDTPDGELPKATKAITFAPENLGFAGGSCPANVVQNIHGKQLTLVNWSQNCGYITTYAKPAILAMATFSALMIIFAGGKPE